MKRDTQRIILILFLIIIPFLLLNFSNISTTFKETYLSLSSPFVKGSDKLVSGVGDFITRIVFSNKILRENRDLRKELDKIKSEVVNYKELEDENFRLKELLEFEKSVKMKTMPAQVIGKDITLGRKSNVINKGEKHDIKLDMAVVSFYGLVGRVVEVGSSISRVMLLTDIDFKVSAIIENSRAEGIVQGLGSFFCEMKYVKHDSYINKGDMVVSSGLGGVFPKGIVLGGVEEISDQKENMFKNVKINPSVDFSKLEEVLIVLEK